MKKTINLSSFQKYVKVKEVEKPKSKIVIGYTRVSTKHQSDTNGSLETQKSSIEEFCKGKGFELQNFFGGTYESAKGDYTRKEFKKLIECVNKQRVKPFGIIVNTISRFSRSGGGGIGILDDLVQNQGVHLFDVKSGLDTTTEEGLNRMNQGLLQSQIENINRKQTIIPGMKDFLELGYRFGASPFGYTHYGPRVKDEVRLQTKQELKINEQGKLLKEGFQMKLSGLYSDKQIIEILKPRGFNGTPQRLSNIWRSPFYCGISTNSLLPDGKPVKGKWESMISQSDFWKLQMILNKNPSGYNHKKMEEYKPLSNFLKCNCCGKNMVGYEVKKKKQTYYKCQKCRGYSLNMETKPKSLRMGGHDLFKELLKKYELDPRFEKLVILQLKKVYSFYNSNEIDRESDIINQIKKVEGQLITLIKRFGINEIDKEVYELTRPDLEQTLTKLRVELNKTPKKLSNLETLIEKSVESLRNVSEIWGSVGYTEKQNLQKTLFPSGVLYDKENHTYLTPEINSFILLTNSFSMECRENKNGINHQKDEKSRIVAGTGIEPVFAP